ncbi:MAG TPA: SDR family oxidoreductase [bacterium]|nr:SDR family oxidoreductase [Candidatus Omnitrophota bacterium]HOJ60575.1 SDR family oxidoreductase [bacterium]HOL92711.1 SDR family oxidoreductase [bacterium]HPO99074.1 SDR family oxidoreductase [bacterium]HXK94963.1 SDR family oxidoreductase [bacterium]
MRFQNKQALITGASSGIGYASALALADEGANIAFTYNKNADGARALEQAIREKGRKVIGFQVDMTRDEDIDRLVDDIHHQFGPVDILFNNAGGLVERMPFLETRKDKWDEIMALNLWSVVRLSQKIGLDMKARGGGVIINNASVAGRFGGGIGASAYGTAKGAVITLTKAMGRELIADNIRVNAIAPGIIDTPFHTHFTPPDVMRELMSRVPIGRPGTAEEVARVVAFLASDDSSYLVGATIDVNGGQWVV